MSSKVSVIIPVYNVEKYLRKCLDSVINQTLVDIEIICVNDGSTDNSLEILQEYAQLDNRIKIVNQENQGLGAARNSGMQVATSDYIGFIDSDDWVALDFYEKLYNKAVSNNADIVRCSYLYSYENDYKPARLNNKFLEFDIKNSLVDRNCHDVVVWNAIYKTEFLSKNDIMFFDNINCAEDISFTARTSFYSEKIYSVGTTMYYYRQNRAGQLCEMSFKKVLAQLKANIITAEFLNSYFENCNNDDYVDAYKRVIWRLNDIFEKGLKIPQFNRELQLSYLQDFVKIVDDFILDKSILIEAYPKLKFLNTKKFSTFIKVSNEDYIKLTLLERIFSIKKTKNKEYKIITILNFKIKVKNNKKQS